MKPAEALLAAAALAALLVVNANAKPKPSGGGLYACQCRKGLKCPGGCGRN
jgi:hypothetical protein